MSWQETTTIMVRTLIDDLDPTNYTYSNERIEQTTLVAAQFINSQADFQNDYVVDLSQFTLTPDPTNDPADNDFINLISCKSACIILGSEVKARSGQAISIKDGPSTIDMRGVAGSLQKLHDQCAAKCEQMMMDYKAGKSIAGQSILGPSSPASFNYTNGGPNNAGEENRSNTFGY